MATLAAASLSEAERRTLDRFVSLLEEEYGEDLRAVWLYGSRARGDAWEESDIDLLVVTTNGGEDGRRIRELRAQAAEAEGIYYGWVSVLAGSPGWVAERRAVEAFFIQEVNRDKIVLAGSEVETPPDFSFHEEPGQVRQRTREYLTVARRHLADAHLIAGSGSAEAVIHDAYYAALNAARALLSEDDRFARGHGGTWNAILERYVEAGRMDASLPSRAAALQEKREQADYGPRTPAEPFPHFESADGAEALEVAKSFLAAVEELLDGRAK